jgi:hypothetical protein
MDTARPVSTPTPNSSRGTSPVPMSTRTIAISLFGAFVVGGVLAGAVPLWALVLIGLVVGAGALYAMDRAGRSRG